eukprot:366303-Chlamydomonas_euryale.AAC.2
MRYALLHSTQHTHHHTHTTHPRQHTHARTSERDTHRRSLTGTPRPAPPSSNGWSTQPCRARPSASAPRTHCECWEEMVRGGGGMVWVAHPRAPAPCTHY